MSVIALVPAAGRGERLGAGIPKALVPVRGEPLLVHAVRGLLSAGCVRHVVVAAPPTALAAVESALAPLGAAVHAIPGGAERTDSVRLALEAGLRVVPDASVVLVHDAARAFTPSAMVLSVVSAVQAGAPAVIPTLPVADTVKRVDDAADVVGTVDRSALRLVQTPQGFAVDVLLRAHRAAAEGRVVATDDAGLVERLGERVATITGHPYALKITTPFDLIMAEAILTETERSEPQQ